MSAPKFEYDSFDEAFSFPAIGDRIRKQDNRCTADPIFIVQHQVRVYGINLEYDPPSVWLHDDESVEVGAETSAQLCKQFEIDGEAEPHGYRLVGYHEYWENVQPFFTEHAADRFIAENRHHYRGELRTFVDCLYRNHEMIAIRNALAKSTSGKIAG